MFARIRDLHKSLVLISAALVTICNSAQEAEDADGSGSVDEVVYVTAQRVNEDIQSVPISVSALTEEMIEDQQVITPSDVQLNAPSVSFTATNFGGASFSIRGIGSIVIGSASESAVSSHINEIPLTTNLVGTEFFDMERVEILRGPQGTLFGRNATGGAINFVTAKPVMGEVSSWFDIERGSYEHTRLKFVSNLGFSDNFGVRIAGFDLEREGYTKNLAYGQTDGSGSTLPGIDDRIDGRDIQAFRATLAYDVSDDLSFWLMWSQIDEDSDRARYTNQVCDRNELPTTGCKPDGFGFDSPHLGASTGGIFGAAAGALPLGVSGQSSSLFDYKRPLISNLRQAHTDMDPVYQSLEDVRAFSMKYNVRDYELGVNVANLKRDFLSNQDYQMDVGATLNPTPLNPTGYWPTSAPSGRAGEDWLPGGCLLQAGSAGVLGGCIVEGIDNSRIFSYDQSDAVVNSWVYEAKLRSNFDGRFNYTLGAQSIAFEQYGDYSVFSNSLDLVSIYGAPAFGLPGLYPGYFNNSTSPWEGLKRDGNSLFGEGYLELNDITTLTVGLRYNADDISRDDTSTLFNAQNHVHILPAVIDGIHTAIAAQAGIPKHLLPLASALAAAIQVGLLHPDFQTNIRAQSGFFWSRTLNILLGPVAAGAPEVDLARLYGVPEAQLQAALQSPAYSPERVAVSNMVPIVPMFGESRTLTGSPSESQFEEWSGRLALDVQADADTLYYGVLSKGYKPGGLNPAIPTDFQDVTSFTFEPENVIAFEGGMKQTLLDGRLRLNSAAYRYDYVGLQTTRIKNNSSVTENIDANIWGLEFEGTFRPALMENLSFDFSYSYLNTYVDGSTSVDPVNRVAGVDDWVLLNNIDPGATTAVNYIARESQITNEIVEAALAAGAAFDLRNGITAVDVSYAENDHGVRIPVYFSTNFLRAMGVDVREGNPTDLDGNELPNSPNHTIRLGAAITVPTTLLDGFLTYRLDYYVQTDSYAREFNTVGDEIDGWSQINGSLIFESGDGRLSARLWVRNILDSNNVTGHYLTSDTSGFFRNYFLTEPQIMGASLRLAFGD